MGLFQKQVVVYKDISDSKQYLQQLEALLPDATGELRKRLEYDIAITKAGIIGEDRILFELKNSGMDMYVLQDIYLEDEDLSAQIDFYVITTKLNFIIECKNLYGNIEIDRNGNFIRTFEYRGKKIREGIYSPITQNERHLQVLRNIRAKESSGLMKIMRNHWFDTFYKSLVVLANPKTIVNDRYAPNALKSQVIRADQLISTIKKMCGESKESSSSMKEMESMAKTMLDCNVEQRKDYIRKYDDLKKMFKETQVAEKVENSEETSEEDSASSAANTLKKICPRCGSALVMRTAKKGYNVGNQFWGCSAFPKCRYIENISR